MALSTDTPATSLPGATRERLQRLILEQATRGERVLSGARLVFCLVVLARFLVVAEWSTPSWAVTIPAIGIGAVASVAMLVRSRRALSETLLVVSSVVDVASCFGALLPNVLWPWAGYQGLLLAPDAGTLLLIVAASGVRLSPKAARVSAALGSIAAAALVLADCAFNRTVLAYDLGQLVLGAILILAAGWVALAFAGRAHELALRGATESLRGALAHQNLSALLEGHHDVRTLLSSATLNADLLLRRLAERGHHRSSDEALPLAGAIREDLRDVNAFVRSIKEHTFEAITGLGELQPGDPHRAFVAARALVAPRFPDTEITFARPEDPPARVSVVGGAETLARMLLNLLVNACEGDGRTGARRVWVELDHTLHAEWVTVRISDDGPGFPAHLLRVTAERKPTTKPSGSGLGLYLVRNLVEASGGHLVLANRAEGGARVDLLLPRG